MDIYHGCLSQLYTAVTAEHELSVLKGSTMNDFSVHTFVAVEESAQALLCL